MAISKLSFQEAIGAIGPQQYLLKIVDLAIFLGPTNALESPTCFLGGFSLFFLTGKEVVCPWRDFSESGIIELII